MVSKEEIKHLKADKFTSSKIIKLIKDTREHTRKEYEDKIDKKIEEYTKGSDKISKTLSKEREKENPQSIKLNCLGERGAMFDLFIRELKEIKSKGVGE